jgi:hypothetical protein
MKYIYVIIAMVLLVSSGCAGLTPAQQRAVTGGGLGAGIGALVGGSEAAALGGLAGAAAGALLEDMRRHRHRY